MHFGISDVTIANKEFSISREMKEILTSDFLYSSPYTFPRNFLLQTLIFHAPDGAEEEIDPGVTAETSNHF